MEKVDKIKIIERTFDGQYFEWDGEIIDIQSNYIETVHSRNETTHPQWKEFRRAYLPQLTKHYGMSNLILTPNQR